MDGKVKGKVLWGIPKSLGGPNFNVDNDSSQSARNTAQERSTWIDTIKAMAS